MLGATLFLAALAALVVFAAWRAEGSGERVGFTAALCFAGAAMAVLLAVVNDVLPFAAGGDDLGYFLDSRRELRGAAEWFGFRRVSGYEQGGYPLLLLWVHQVAGESLFVRKALNLFFFLVLAVVWYRIGRLVAGRHTGFVFGAALLLSTPLWYYWVFLLKDMTVVLLQSTFLLGMVHISTGRSSRGAWLLVAAATVLVIPFRIYMLLVNVAVLAATVVLLGRQSARRKAAFVMATAAMVAALAAVGSNPDSLRALGVRETRVLEYGAVMELSGRFIEQRERYAGTTGTVLFPVLFLVGETTGLRAGNLPPGTGRVEAAALRLRGAATLPWIFVGTPLAVFGLLSVLARRKGRPSAVDGAEAAVVEEEERPGGWLPLLLFLGFYVIIAWIVEDTVRWRMPAYPVLAALAAHAWIRLGPRSRLVIPLAWTTAVVGLSVAYYVFLQ